ncbi:unnamed protein product [Ilex paraguariensis]|uniref:Uncharacterized protein n=1 Tax=Ilex paraguariensis TaxID=185542 RepID=A0ABC8RHB9_9AQUA
MENSQYKTLEIVQKPTNSRVFNLYMNRPKFRNALSRDFFSEFPRALSSLDQNPDVAVIILSGIGESFCSGIDLKTLTSIVAGLHADRGRTNERIRREIKAFQDAITAIEKCRKPVIAAIHGACVGGGVDIATACDMRFCTEDAFFSVKEVDLAITADLGTLQRLPSIVGHGNAMELALTGRRVSGLEAKQMGLVSSVFASKEALSNGVSAIAEGKLALYSLLFIPNSLLLIDCFQLW